MGKASGEKQFRDEGEKRDIPASPKAAGFPRPVLSAWVPRRSRSKPRVGTLTGSNGIGKAMVVLALIILFTLGIAVFKRNSTWKDELTLRKDAVKNSAYKARGHNNLGLVYDELGRAQEAIEE